MYHPTKFHDDPSSSLGGVCRQTHTHTQKERKTRTQKRHIAKYRYRFQKKMLFLYSAHISLKQRLKALYNIPPTDLVKPLPTQLPGKHTRSAATGALPQAFNIRQLSMCRVPILNTAGWTEEMRIKHLSQGCKEVTKTRVEPPTLGSTAQRLIHQATSPHQ